MTGDDLFDGVEKSEQIGGGHDSPMGGSLKAKLKAALQHWYSHLTYREVHSATVGFAPLFSALLLLGFPGVPGAITGGMLTLSLALGAVAVTGVGTRSRKLTRYVLLEPHYLLGGQSLAALLGSLALSVVLAVRWLVGVIA